MANPQFMRFVWLSTWCYFFWLVTISAIPHNPSLVQRSLASTVTTAIKSLHDVPHLTAFSPGPHSTSLPFLFQASLPTATAQPVIAPPSNSSSSYQKSNVESYWEQYQECPTEWMSLTTENLAEANVTDWYRELEQAFHANSLGKNTSFMTWFAQKMWGDSDFLCPIDADCSIFPSCTVIANHVVKHKESGTTVIEALEHSRRVFFIAKAFYYQQQVFKLVLNDLEQVKATALAHIEQIVLDFTRQESPNAAVECKIRTAIMDFVWSATMGGILQVLGAEEFKDTNLGGLSTWLNCFRTLVLNIAEIEDMEFQTGHPAPSSAANDNLNDFHLVSSYASGMCADLGAGAPNRNFEKTAQWKVQIDKIFKQYISALNTFYKQLIGKQLLVASHQSISLADWATPENFPFVHKQIEQRDSAQSVKPFDKALTEYMISISLASAKCFLKCRQDYENGDVDKAGKFCTDADAAIRKLRLCPAEEPTTVCQLECWTSQSFGNHQDKPPGLDRLQSYGITLPEVLNSTWNNFKRLSNSNAPPLLGAQFRFGFDMELNEGYSALALPVCRSNHLKMTSDYKHGHEFPFTCGDWRSNESSGFFDAIGYGPTSDDFLTGKNYETMQLRMVDDFRELDPLTHVLGLCGANMYWPQDSDPPILQYDRKNKMSGICKSLMDITIDMDPVLANYAFCRGDWPEYQHLARHERDDVSRTKRGLVAMGHADKCIGSNGFMSRVEFIEHTLKNEYAIWLQSPEGQAMQKLPRWSPYNQHKNSMEAIAWS